MITAPSERQRVLEAFPFLSEVDAELQSQVLNAGSLVRLPAGHLICQQGAQCALLPLVVAGTGRVYKLGENGREITLYRVNAGDSCVVTASCILSGQTFPAVAECETDVEALVVKPVEVHRWMGVSRPWREYVFGLIANRLQEVFGVLDAVLFQRLDQRLIQVLLCRAAEAQVAQIPMTHQALAVELGSSREVITRVLKGLEAQGLLRTKRGMIELLDMTALERHASDA